MTCLTLKTSDSVENDAIELTVTILKNLCIDPEIVSVVTVKHLSNSSAIVVVGRRRLRSADINTCIVSPTRTCLGDRSFSVAGLQLWNS